jgi:hypothetical protein
MARLRRPAIRPLQSDIFRAIPGSRCSIKRSARTSRRSWLGGSSGAVPSRVSLKRSSGRSLTPRLNLIRFHGVLGPAAKWRRSVVPTAASSLANPGAETACDCGNQPKRDSNRRRNYTWAALMARVFEVDVLECPQCKGRLRILAAIHPPENTRRILECLNLPTRAPPIKGASNSLNEVPVRP